MFTPVPVEASIFLYASVLKYSGKIIAICAGVRVSMVWALPGSMFLVMGRAGNVHALV